MFDRYVTAVEAALCEMIVHYQEIVAPAAERIAELSRAEAELRSLQATECTSDDEFRDAIEQLIADAKSETEAALRAYASFEDAIGRIEGLVREAKYEVDEPEVV